MLHTIYPWKILNFRSSVIIYFIVLFQIKLSSYYYCKMLTRKWGRMWDDEGGGKGLLVILIKEVLPGIVNYSVHYD